MILIGGASPTYQNGMGAFQEERQVQIASPFCKFAHAVEHVHRIPFYVEMAVRHSIYGRPGATYLDMPDDIILGEVDEDKVHQAATVAEPPRMQALEQDIEQALNVLESAERPLVIVGKGMAWSRAEDEVRAFIERTAGAVPRLADGQGRDGRHPSAVGRRRPLPRAAGSRRHLPAGRSAELDHAFRPAAALQQEGAHRPARHLARGDRPERAGRGGAGRRRPSDCRAAEQGAGEPPVVLSEGHALARGDRREVGGERQADPADDRRQFDADQLLPRLQGHQRLDCPRTR